MDICVNLIFRRKNINTNTHNEGSRKIDLISPVYHRDESSSPHLVLVNDPHQFPVTAFTNRCRSKLTNHRDLNSLHGRL